MSKLCCLRLTLIVLGGGVKLTMQREVPVLHKNNTALIKQISLLILPLSRQKTFDQWGGQKRKPIRPFPDKGPLAPLKRGRAPLGATLALGRDDSTKNKQCVGPHIGQNSTFQARPYHHLYICDQWHGENPGKLLNPEIFGCNIL